MAAISRPSLRAVIFDLGGVILRTDDPAPRLSLAARMGKTRAELEAIVFNNPVSQEAEEGRASLADVWEHIRQQMGLAPEEVPAFEAAFFGGDRIDFELVAWIRALRPAYCTALLSNGWRRDLPAYLHDVLHIPADTFDVVISSAVSGIAKPRPESFALALQQTGAAPETAVFIDDNAANIAAARAMGIHVVHFRSPAQARAELAVLLPDRNP